MAQPRTRCASGGSPIGIGGPRHYRTQTGRGDSPRRPVRNAFLADLLEHADQPFAIGYPDGSLGYLNSAFERLTGYTREELRGMDWVAALTPPEWREVERAHLEELHRTRHPVRYEKEYLRKDGTRVPIELLVHLSSDDRGQPLYYSFVTDLTARKQAEQALRDSEAQFRTLANAIPQLCWIANADGWIFWYNQRWYEYTGTTPEQMEGWGWQSVHDPEALPRVLERWEASIATGQPFDMVLPLRGADGLFRPFLTRMMPVSAATARSPAGSALTPISASSARPRRPCAGRASGCASPSAASAMRS